MPLFLTFMGSPDDEDLWTDEANEVRENCLHAFEAFVLRCPSEVAAFLPTILPVVKDFMTYDPNYNYDAEGDDDEDEVINQCSLCWLLVHLEPTAQFC